MPNDTLEADIQAIKDAGGNDNDVMNYLKENNVSFSDSNSKSKIPLSQDQQISQRPSAIADLTKNPTTMEHPLGAVLRTLGGAAELYQGVPASIALDLQKGRPQDILSNLTKVATGQRPAEYGDVFQGASVPKPLAAAGGLYTDIVLSPGGAKLLSGLTKAGVVAAKNIPNAVKPILKWEKITDQADKAKGALDALKKSYSSMYEVALKEVENVPTNVDFSKIPKKVLDVIRNKKDTYGIEFNADSSIKNTVGNVNKIKRASDEMLTPTMRAETTSTEMGQVERFAGHISGEMRAAARKVGKPIDSAMDEYGRFKNNYNLVNDKLTIKKKIADSNKLKEMTRLNASGTIKEAYKTLAKESPELKSVMDSRRNRELVKALLKITSVVVPGTGATIAGINAVKGN